MTDKKTMNWPSDFPGKHDSLEPAPAQLIAQVRGRLLGTRDFLQRKFDETAKSNLQMSLEISLPLLNTKIVLNYLDQLEQLMGEVALVGAKPLVDAQISTSSASPAPIPQEMVEEQDEFEAWAVFGSEPYDLKKLPNGCYASGDTQNAWYGWKGRNALRAMQQPTDQPRTMTVEQVEEYIYGETKRFTETSALLALARLGAIRVVDNEGGV